MPKRLLPTPWNVYNLARSPFFQQPLASGEQTSRPLDLFVGRESEIERLRGTIHGVGENATVQAIAGALWKLSQGPVSTAIVYLVRQGYVIARATRARTRSSTCSPASAD